MRASSTRGSSVSVSSGGQNPSEAAAMLAIRHKIALLGQKTARQESFTNAEVTAVAGEALGLSGQKSVAACLNELLFSRSPRGPPGTPVLRGSEGVRQLKRENRQERCGKLFREGDLAYNCLTCQVDSTCVICQECFDESDHTGHEVTFHRTDPGGCCDCGDEEAWAPSGFCSRHGAHNLAASADTDATTDARDNLPPGVRVQFEAILDAVFANVQQGLSEVFKSYTREFDRADVAAPEDLVSEPDSLNVVLNNDDVHTFEEVQQALARLRPDVTLSRPAITEKTSMIDKHGRAPVFKVKFSNHDELVKGLQVAHRVRKHLDTAGLLVCISRGVQLTFERRAVAGLAWVLEMAQLSQGLARCVVERFISPPVHDIVDTVHAEAYMRAKCGETHYWPQDGGPSHVPDALSDQRLSIVETALKYDALIPKQFAKHLQSLWLGLLTHVDFKQTLGSAFMTFHRHMASAFSNGLGTSQETFGGLSVQLLTVPSVIQRIENEFRERGKDVVVESLDTIKNFLLSCCCKVNADWATPDGPVRRLAQFDFAESTGINHERYMHAILDARYVMRLVKHPLVDAEDMTQFKRLRAFLGAIAIAQRMNPQRRHQGAEHVIQETNDWIRAFKLSMALHNIIRLGSQQVGAGIASLAASQNKVSLLELVHDVGKLSYEHSFLWHHDEIVARPHVHDGPNKFVVQTAMHDPPQCTLVAADAATNAPSDASPSVGPISPAELRFPCVSCENLDPTLPAFTNFICKGDVFRGAHVSHHLPVHRFFASVVRALAVAVERYPAKFNDGAISLENALHQALHLRNGASPASKDINFDQFSEDVLRVVATNAQVGAQLWRRTGMTMDNILTNYKGVCATSMYQCDVSFLQIAVAVQGADRVVFLLLDKFGLRPYISSGSRSDAVSALPGSDLHNSYGQLLDELLRLLVHMSTEIPVARGAGRAAVRREVIHALAASETNCTFSRVMGSVRNARIAMSDGPPEATAANEEGTASSQSPATSSPEADVMEESYWVSAGEVENMLDLVANRHGSASSTSVSYSLKSECWDEVDPLYWNVSRQHEELVAERLCKANDDMGRESWPMVGTPPGPPVRVFAAARLIPWSRTVQQQIIGQVCVDVFRAAHVAVVRLSEAESKPYGLEASSHSLPAETVTHTAKVPPGLLYTVLHMITLAMHTADALGTSEATSRERMLLACNLSLVEIVVNLEALFTSEGQDEKVANLRWCGDQLALRHPKAVHVLREALSLASTPPQISFDHADSQMLAGNASPNAAMSVDTLISLEDVELTPHLQRSRTGVKGDVEMHESNDGGSGFDAQKGRSSKEEHEGGETADSKKKKKKKVKGAKKKHKRDRGAEAQKAAMARMEAAQARALERMGGEGAFTEDAVHEENYCVLCHEHLQKKQYAFLGYVRGSAWGNVLPLLPGETCPPEVLSTPRKPAGWMHDVEDQSDADLSGERETHGLAHAVAISRRRNEAARQTAAGATDGDMDWTLANDNMEGDHSDDDDDDDEGDAFGVDMEFEDDFGGFAEVMNEIADDDEELGEDIYENASADGDEDAGNGNEIGRITLGAGTGARAGVGQDQGAQIDGDALRRNFLHFGDIFDAATGRLQPDPGEVIAAIHRAARQGEGQGATPGRQDQGDAPGGNDDADVHGQVANVHIAQRIQHMVAHMIREQQQTRSSTRKEQVVVENPEHVVPASQRDVYVGFCSHAMHVECLQTYIASLRSRGGWSSVAPLPNVAEHEFLCPMCKSLSNVILPHIPEARAPVEKRRRVSSSSATPHEMVRFITGELDGLDARDLSFKAREDIETFADMLHMTYKTPTAEDLSLAATHRRSLRSPRKLVPAGKSDRLLGLWKALGFSLRAQASVRQPACGDDDSNASFRQLTERVQGTMKQWLSMLRAASVLMHEPTQAAGGSAGPSLDNHRDTANSSTYSQGGVGASFLTDSFRATLRGLTSSSSSSSSSSSVSTPSSPSGPSGGDVGSGASAQSSSVSSAFPRRTPGFGEGTGATASSAANRERSSSLSEALGRLRSPFNLSFLGSFGRRGQDGPVAASDSSEGPSRPTSSLSSGGKGPRGRDDPESTASNGVAEALFEMLSRGRTRRCKELCAGLAPGKRMRVTLVLDDDLESLVAPTLIKAARRATRADGAGSFELAVGDRVMDIDTERNTMVVEREIIPDGVLLNMADPVTLTVALLSALPAPLYIRAVRAVAMATLVQGVMEAPSVGVCEKCHDSRKFAVAEGWVPALRRVAPEATADHVYYALYVKLARFLRASVLLLAVASEAKDASEFIELDEYATDETEALWMRFLGLPSIGEMTNSGELMEIIERWKSTIGAQPSVPESQLLVHPCCLDQTRLRLISLPTNYEQLLKIVRRSAKCPTTGRVTSRPALCLRCGMVVCATEKCCSRNGIGPGTLHAQSCGGGSGAFLLVQRCIVMLVHGVHQARMSAPYVDSHGEVDDFLSRGRPLRFHEPAFKALQFICSNNEICHKVVSQLTMQEPRPRQHQQRF